MVRTLAETAGEFEIEPVEDYMVIIRSLNDRIGKIQKGIKERAEEIKEVRIIMSITGFDYLSAMTVYASIGDIDRFPGPKQLSSYFGMIPSTEQSGGKRKHGPITKEGDRSIVATARKLTEAIYWMLERVEGFRQGG